MIVERPAKLAGMASVPMGFAPIGIGVLPGTGRGMG